MTQAPGRPPPKYRQIADGLRTQIEAGEFPVGAQLPSIGELKSAYGAAKGTVDQALAALRELGLVETRHGAGSFVLREQPGPSEAQLSEQVAALRERVDDLVKLAETAGDAGLREKVSEIETALIELYGKTGYEYPQSNGGQQERRARHG